jgi:hypothetical protein
MNFDNIKVSADFAWQTGSVSDIKGTGGEMNVHYVPEWPPFCPSSALLFIILPLATYFHKALKSKKIPTNYKK